MSGASDDVRPDVAADALRPDLPDADAGKSADRELDARAQDGSQWGDSRSAVPAEPAEPCTRDAAQFAEQSCAAPAFADALAHSAVLPQPDAVAEPEAQQARWEQLVLPHSPAALAE